MSQLSIGSLHRLGFNDNQLKPSFNWLSFIDSEKLLIFTDDKISNCSLILPEILNIFMNCTLNTYRSGFFLCISRISFPENILLKTTKRKNKKNGKITGNK